jgi:ABC-2 type transport system permease protein
MASYDLRQRLRDRSVIIFSLLVPLALMIVTNLTIGAADDVELDRVHVAVRVPEGDRLAAALIDGARRGGPVEVVVQEASEADVRRLIEDGGVPLGILVPDGFGPAVSRGAGPVVEVIEGDGTGIETDIVIAVVQSVLDGFGDRAVAAAAAGQLGLSPEQAGRVAEQAATAGPDVTLVAGRAAREQLSPSGAVVAGQAGLFLLFTVGFGVLGLVVEREHGTLTRLRSMPMRPELIVAAKGLVSAILGVVATTVLLVAGSLLFDVDFGRPWVVAVLIVGAVVSGTSLMFIIARVARTAEQATVVQSILAIVLGMAGGAFFPIPATGLAGTILDLNPIAAFTRGLGISSGGGGLGDLGAPLATMVGFTVVCGLASRLLPDRGTEL